MWKTIKDWFSRIHYIINSRIDQHSLKKDGWKYQKSPYKHGYEWVIEIKAKYQTIELTIEQVDSYDTWEVKYYDGHFGGISRKVRNRYELYLFVNALTLNLDL